MNHNRLLEWMSSGGRVGRRGYWLHFMLPALALALTGLLIPMAHSAMGLAIPGGVRSVLGLAALWVFVMGNLKRVRHLRMSQGKVATLMGLWATAMGICSAVAGGLVLFGLLAMMSNGGPDGEALMMYAVLVFLTPVILPLLLVGFLPGGLEPAVVAAASDGVRAADVDP